MLGDELSLTYDLSSAKGFVCVGGGGAKGPLGGIGLTGTKNPDGMH